MEKAFALAMLLVAVSTWDFQNGAAAQNAQVSLPRQEFPLWTGDAPGALGKETKDIPTLTPYFASPGKETGSSFIICPGGAYAALAPHEGLQYALWLNEQGFGNGVPRN